MQADHDGVTIDYDDVGAGPAVILLHGFPDSRRLWRHQVDALAAAGYRCIVPDLRGYGTSDKPADVADYSIGILAGDVAAVLDAAGVERAHVVGHDWGAALAWIAASLFPERIDHLVALSVGNPVVFRGAGVEQWQKSWYMLLFQFPGVAEEWLAANDWANLRAWGGHPDIDAVIAELERSGALTPALNWYRANVAPDSYVTPAPDLPRIQAPTLGVWGSLDMALTETQMTLSAGTVDGPWRYERLDDVGHWLPLEAPERITMLLESFLPDPAAPRQGPSDSR